MLIGAALARVCLDGIENVDSPANITDQITGAVLSVGPPGEGIISSRANIFDNLPCG